MDKKERRKKKSQSNPSAPSQPIILGALRSDQVYVCMCLCVCGSKPPGDTGMDLLTWTRKGKDSNIYYIYIYIHIYIDWYVTQKSKSGEFVGTFCYCYCYYYLTVVIVFVCVCVYPCKQFVVVTIRRTGSWNTIPTLPYLTLLTFFYRTLTRSTGIHHRFIVWFLERTIILEDEKSPPRNKFRTCPRTHWNRLPFNPIQFSKYSRRALEKTFTLVVVVVVVVVIRKAEAKPNQTEYIKSSGRKFPFLRSKLHTNTKKKKEEDKKTTTTTSTSKP